MKCKVKLKTITLFLMVAGVKCEFLDEMKVSLKKLQLTVDMLSLEQRKTNIKVVQLEEKIDKLGTKVITVEDLNEANNKISDAIDQLKDEMKNITQDERSGNGCIEAETNVDSEDDIDVLNHVVKEVEEKGKINHLILVRIKDTGK